MDRHLSREHRSSQHKIASRSSEQLESFEARRGNRDNGMVDGTR
jgi:hypothetical protein